MDLDTNIFISLLFSLFSGIFRQCVQISSNVFAAICLVCCDQWIDTVAICLLIARNMSIIYTLAICLICCDQWIDTVAICLLIAHNMYIL